MISKVSIEQKRQKLIALAHFSREIALMLSMKNEVAQTRLQLMQQVAHKEHRAMDYNQQHDYEQRPLDLRTNTYN